MKLRCSIALLTALTLTGCAQSPPPEASFNDPTALPYVTAHGVQVQVQVPKDGFVSAQMVIDAKAAEAAALTTNNVTRSSVQAGGVVGLLVASAINTQTGTGVLERDARAAAQKDARPMAALLSNQAVDDKLTQRFRQAGMTAGLHLGQGAVTAHLIVEPQLVLSADRGSFTLVSRVQVQDIAGSALYRRHIEVVGQPFRRCGTQCVDDGQLDMALVDGQLQQCIDETLRVTNLRQWAPGRQVNLERCLAANGRFDGHIVQGHVDATAECLSVDDQEGSWIFRFRHAPGPGRVTVEKGSVCVNGTSLTCFESTADGFAVAIIPYTYEHTSFQQLRAGEVVNLEFDIVGKYVAKLLASMGEGMKERMSE